MTVAALAAKYEEQIGSLAAHIYRAAHQWDSFKEQQENLEPGTVLSVEDYQMNLTVEHFETTTSAFMGANTEQLAMYPIAIYFRLKEGEPVRKAGLVLMSEDRKHDYHQVLASLKLVFVN